MLCNQSRVPTQPGHPSVGSLTVYRRRFIQIEYGNGILLGCRSVVVWFEKVGKAIEI